MSVTQLDIANRVGVSRGLVKFALTGTGHVAPATREKILREAKSKLSTKSFPSSWWCALRRAL